MAVGLQNSPKVSHCSQQLKVMSGGWYAAALLYGVSWIQVTGSAYTEV